LNLRQLQLYKQSTKQGNITSGNSSGWGISGSLSGGGIFGWTGSYTLSEGGTAVNAGLGVGLGVGGTATIGYEGDIT